MSEGGNFMNRNRTNVNGGRNTVKRGRNNMNRRGIYVN